jgi:regulator of RNase E activity RraA
MAGPAFTVRYVPIGDPPGTVGDYIDDVPSGAVVVLDNQGRLDATVWGDILTRYSSMHKISGTVVWGVCRDTDVARELGYPIYSSGSYMRTGKDRVEVAETGGRVSLNSVQVAPGDLVVGDDDGIVVVPEHRMDDVWAVVSQVSSAEHAIREEVSAGATITEARARHGYHRLQTRSN